MIGNIVARRYAKALFSLGAKKGLAELETFGKDLDLLSALLKDSPILLRALGNLIFSVEEKKKVVAKILAEIKACQTICNFCSLLAEKQRLGALPDIAQVFAAMLDVEKGVIRGELVTAVELDQTKQKSLLAKLESQAGRKLVLEFSADSSILGGVVLKVGDRVMDASLRAQLGMLKENIKRGE